MRALCFLQDATPGMKEEAFSHEWTNYPSSLFEPDARIAEGYAMRKGNKSDFLNHLVADTENIQFMQTPVSDNDEVITSYIIDGMSFVQRYQQMGAKTFEDLASKYLKKILLMIPKNCRTIHFVGDRYDVDPTLTLKGDERQRRSKMQTGLEYQIARGLEIPKWDSFIQNSNNRANLLALLLSTWCHSKSLNRWLTLILGGTFKERGQSVMISKEISVDVPELCCDDHEEADTQITHMFYSVEHELCERVIIQATDTDNAVLCLYHFSRQSQLKELWFEKSEMFLPIHLLLQELSLQHLKDQHDLTSSLLAGYVLSGCDTVSYPFRRGKRKAVKAAIQLTGLIPSLSKFGSDVPLKVSNEVYEDAIKFMVTLYGHPEFYSLDTLRAHLFLSTKSDLRVLPPTNDAARQHILRSLYQISLYKRAHLSSLNLPLPNEFGRMVKNGNLVPVLMTKESKPKLAKPLFCKCISSRCIKNCSCRLASATVQ